MKKNYFSDIDSNQIPCGIVAFEKNAPWRIIHANERYYSYFSNGNTDTLNIFSEDTGMLESLDERLGTSGKGVNVYYRCNAGKDAPLRITMAVCRYTDDAYLGILNDATERFDMFKRMELEKAKFAMALCSDKNMVFEDNLLRNTSVLYVKPEGCDEVKTIKTANIYDELVNAMVHPEDKMFFKENIYNPKKNMLSARLKMNGEGDWKWYRIYRQFEQDDKGNMTRVYGVIRDVDDEKKREDELRKRIEIDPVLKVYNRNAGVNKINSYLKKHPNRKDYALLIMDIDDFKNINDTYGHLYGDAVIEMTAGAIKEAVGKLGFVGRYGGDEFFAFLHSVSNEEIGRAADNILEKIKNFHLADDIRITGSIGIAFGDTFRKTPTYKALLEKADKALYHVKENGKAHWCAYNDDMSENGGRGLGYEKDDEDNTELLDSKDMMKVFLELSAGAETSDEAVYSIMRYIMEKYDCDWLQIMEVNCSEDSITVKYEWCRDEDFHNNAGKSGYYVHSDIMNFRNYFENNPVFMVCPENCVGFLPKFDREFEKNMRYNVVYISDTTTDDNFYMFVCTRFDKAHVWKEEECDELNLATKMMAMYISQTNKKSENEQKLQYRVDHDRKTDLWSLGEFYVQTGRLRKLARENDEEIIMFHCDFGNFIKFNRDFGIESGDDTLLEYGRKIQNNFDPDRLVATHLDGTDVFYIVTRVKKGDRSIIEKFNNGNIDFCESLREKYEGSSLVIRTGVYLLGDTEDGEYGFDCGMLAKRYAKDRDRTFYVLYDNEMENI